MATIIDFNDRVSVEEAASQWIAKIDRKLSVSEESEFKLWLTASVTHYTVFMKMAEHWDRTESLQKLNLPKNEPEKMAKNNTKNSRVYKPYMAAACFLWVAVLGFMAYQQLPMSKPIDANQIIYRQAFSTTTKAASEFPLPDGTQLKLNVRSKVAVSYSLNMRKIELQEGEVYIDVAHDTTRPLVVFVKNRFIKAVGTAFNVELVNEKNIELTITEGKVIFGIVSSSLDENHALLKGTALSRGQQAVLGGVSDIVSAKSAAEIQALLSWKQGALIFNEQTLKEVLSEMQRYNDVEFVLKSPDLENIKVTGYFKANNLQQFLAAMENNFSIHHEIINGNKIILFN
jgi:transmembrane sensor